MGRKPDVDWRPINAALERRSQGYCERCGKPTTIDLGHRHHRQLRSQGGDNSLSNLVLVCGVCHGEIHQRPALAYLDGWLVKSHDDPAAVPLKHAPSNLVLLLAPTGLTQRIPGASFHSTLERMDAQQAEARRREEQADGR